jgi:predicted NBD/HSP70 family sugar kinase
MSAAATLPKLARLSAEPTTPIESAKPSKILVADIGGTKIKILASGQVEPRKVSSGKKLTPGRMVEAIQKLAEDWEYEAVSLGYPGLVGPHGPRSEPGNLGPGWVGFDFAAAFGCPVRIINDAAMQTLGSYEGGRMLFLGLGTGLGSTLIAENTIIPLELGDLPCKEGGNLGAALGKSGLRRLGKEAWAAAVKEFVAAFATAFVVDYIVLGGGNAKKLKGLVPGVRLGHNLTAFRGGLRLWNIEYASTLSAEGPQPPVYQPPSEWRMV